MHQELSPESISALLHTQHVGRALHCFEHVDSTNAEAGRLAGRGVVHGTVVCADRQSAGRGRRGRQWYSEPGKSLCFSVLLRPLLPVEGKQEWITWIPLAAAVGVAAGIRRSLGLEPTLKWPNDLLMQERKLGGVLCESLATADRSLALIVGIGLNVSQHARDFPDELTEAATSLAIHTGTEVQRASLFASILNELEPRLDSVCGGDVEHVRREYRQACGTIGRMVRIDRQHDVCLVGRARDIAPSGALLVEARREASIGPAEELVEVLAGDVVHLRSA